MFDFPFQNVTPLLLASLHADRPTAVALKTNPPHSLGGRYSRIDEALFFDFIIDETIHILSELSARPCEIQTEYANRVSLNGRFHLKSKEWLLQGNGKAVATARLVHIKGSKNEIVNVWIFPSLPELIPVFAAEIIGTNDSVKVAFIDLQIPAAGRELGQRCLEQLQSIRDAIDSLQSPELPPNWAIDASPGAYLYGRDLESTKLSELRAAYTQYLRTYATMWFSKKHLQTLVNAVISDQAIQILQDYQRHHRDHSPGKKYLSTLFGSDWTQRFMDEFLFNKPLGANV